MKLNRRMILIALSISACNSVTAMKPTSDFAPTFVKGWSTDRSLDQLRRSEENTKYYFIMQNTTPTQAKKLASFARDNSNPVFAHEVAEWLMINRNDFAEHSEWNDFMNMFIFHLTGHHIIGDDVKNKKLNAVVNVIKGTVYTLKPNEDYSQLLVDEMQAAIHKAEQEFNQLSK